MVETCKVKAGKCLLKIQIGYVGFLDLISGGILIFCYLFGAPIFSSMAKNKFAGRFCNKIYINTVMNLVLLGACS